MEIAAASLPMAIAGPVRSFTASAFIHPGFGMAVHAIGHCVHSHPIRRNFLHPQRS